MDQAQPEEIRAKLLDRFFQIDVIAWCAFFGVCAVLAGVFLWLRVKDAFQKSLRQMKEGKKAA